MFVLLLKTTGTIVANPNPDSEPSLADPTLLLQALLPLLPPSLLLLLPASTTHQVTSSHCRRCFSHRLSARLSGIDKVGRAGHVHTLRWMRMKEDDEGGR